MVIKSAMPLSHPLKDILMVFCEMVNGLSLLAELMWTRNLNMHHFVQLYDNQMGKLNQSWLIMQKLL